MPCSLIPERPLLVSPSLAATIGLEEATMLSVLHELALHTQDGKNELTLDAATVGRWMPFWTPHDIQRISKNLSDKGIILLGSAPYLESNELRFSFNEARAAPDTTGPRQATARLSAPSAHNTPQRGANRIAPNWQPSDQVMTQLAQRNIPADFAHAQVDEFVTYWRERDEPAHAWGAKFLSHVIYAWRNHETRFEQQRKASTMSQQWHPSTEAMEMLIQHAAINSQFVEDAIPEFVLYWQERGENSRTWNSKFIQHVRRQWNKYTATVENETVPKPIPENWQPAEDVYDVLRLANIDLAFAESLVPEFVLFWRDNKRPHTSWNTKFLQHVKYHWARRGTGEMASGDNTRARSLVDDLTDNSWAY